MHKRKHIVAHTRHTPHSHVLNTWPRANVVSWWPVIGLITKRCLSLTHTHTQSYSSMCFLLSSFSCGRWNQNAFHTPLMFSTANHGRNISSRLHHIYLFIVSICDKDWTNWRLFFLQKLKLFEFFHFSALWNTLDCWKLDICTGCTDSVGSTFIYCDWWVTGGDVRSYLQEERQDRHECVGAAWQQGEGSATVHPQRVISRCGHQPVQKEKTVVNVSTCCWRNVQWHGRFTQITEELVSLKVSILWYVFKQYSLCGSDVFSPFYCCTERCID